MDILSKCWKVKYLSALSEMLHFYDVEKPGTFGVPFRIFGAYKKRVFLQENRDEWDPYAFGAAKKKKLKILDTEFLSASRQIV